MKEILKDELHFVVSRIPKDVRKLMEEFPTLIVGGGFIRATICGEKPSDIDLFAESVDTLERAADKLTVERRARIHKSPNALTVLSPPRIPVQFITRWTYDSLEKLLDSFDFTIAQAAVAVVKTGENITWIGCCSERFYPDLAGRRLVYTYPLREEEAGGSLMRVRKFLTKGYNIQAGSLGGVIARLMMRVDMDKLPHGMDREMGLSKVITGLLREVDPLTVVDGVDFVDEHNVILETNNETVVREEE